MSPQLKRVRETEKQCKPLLERNKCLAKRNDELMLSLQRMEEKLKAITKENSEMVGVPGSKTAASFLSLPSHLTYCSLSALLFKYNAIYESSDFPLCKQGTFKGGEKAKDACWLWTLQSF